MRNVNWPTGLQSMRWEATASTVAEHGDDVLAPYLDGAPLPSDLPSLVSLRDQATEAWLCVEDDMRGVTRICEWTTRVVRDEWHEGFDVSHDVESMDRRHDGKPNWHLVHEAFGDTLSEWIAEHDDEEQLLSSGYTAAAMGMTTGEWLAEQDRNVLIEDFAPEQPKRLPRKGDAGAADYWAALRGLVYELHHAIGKLQPADGELPPADCVPPERQRPADLPQPYPLVPVEPEPGLDRRGHLNRRLAIARIALDAAEDGDDFEAFQYWTEQVQHLNQLLASLDEARPWERRFDPAATDRRWGDPAMWAPHSLPSPVCQYFGDTARAQNRAMAYIASRALEGSYSGLKDDGKTRVWRLPPTRRAVSRYIDRIWLRLESEPQNGLSGDSRDWCKHRRANRCPECRDERAQAALVRTLDQLAHSYAAGYVAAPPFAAEAARQQAG